MKIAFLWANWIPDISINTNLFQRLYYLSETNEIHLLTPYSVEISPKIEDRVEIKRSPRVFKKIELLMYYIYLTRTIFNLKRDQFELIITERSILSIWGFLAKKIAGIKWVADIWDDPEKENYYLYKKLSFRWLMNKLKNVMLKIILRYSDLVVCSILPEKIRSYKVKQKRILALPNSIDLDAVHSSHAIKDAKNFTIIFIGLMRKDRGIDILVDSIQKLGKEIPDLKLILAGDPEIQKVEAFIKRQPLQIQIEYHGWIEHKKALSLIDLADICVCPFKSGTDIEYTYPVKILEYLAMGKIVIASNLKGIRTIITSGENGILVEPENAEKLSEAILRVYKDTNLAQKLQAAARKSVLKYHSKDKNKIIDEKLKALFGNE